MSELLLTLRCAWHILAAVAEHEAKVISEHTKAVLAAAKRRGVKDDLQSDARYRRGAPTGATIPPVKICS
jgi:DNA invertase Pin-like site-specific DNA recombinase